VVDISELIHNLYTKSELRYDFWHFCNNLISPNGLARTYLFEHLPHLRQQTGSVAFIHGADKPNLELTDRGYGFRFVDGVDNCVNMRQLVQDRVQYADELFYWAPESAQILIKQSHVLRRAIDSGYLDQHCTVEPTQGIHFIKNRRNDQWLSADAINTTIYPYWDPTTFSVGKALPNQLFSFFFGLRDSWFLKQPSTTSYRNFMGGVRTIYKSIDANHFRNSDWRMGYLKLHSKIYMIE
jgi:hypothetical protein